MITEMVLNVSNEI